MKTGSRRSKNKGKEKKKIWHFFVLTRINSQRYTTISQWNHNYSKGEEIHPKRDWFVLGPRRKELVAITMHNLVRVGDGNFGDPDQLGDPLPVIMPPSCQGNHVQWGSYTLFRDSVLIPHTDNRRMEKERKEWMNERITGDGKRTAPRHPTNVTSGLGHQDRELRQVCRKTEWATKPPQKGVCWDGLHGSVQNLQDRLWAVKQKNER